MFVIEHITHKELGNLSFGVMKENSALAKDISVLLVSCAIQLAEEYGGHVPNDIVHNRILKHYTTPESITALNQGKANRFFLMNSDKKILATALVAKEHGILMPEETHGIHDTQTLSKPAVIRQYHSVFNIAVDPQFRRQRLATILLQAICDRHKDFFSGKGLYIRSEPPEYSAWSHMCFIHIPEIDEFFADAVPLPKDCKEVVDYNKKYVCICPKNDQWMNAFHNRKLKYFGFVRDFEK